MMTVQRGRAPRCPKQGVMDPACVPWRQQGGSPRAPLQLWLAEVGLPIVPDTQTEKRAGGPVVVVRTESPVRVHGR